MSNWSPQLASPLKTADLEQIIQEAARVLAEKILFGEVDVAKRRRAASGVAALGLPAGVREALLGPLSVTFVAVPRIVLEGRVERSIGAVIVRGATREAESKPRTSGPPPGTMRPPRVVKLMVPAVVPGS